MAWNGQSPHHTQMPFWDFVQHLDPNHTGAGVDHAGPQGPPGGFPFGGGEGGFNYPWAARGRWGWGGRGGRGRYWGGGHGRHGGWRGRRGTDGEDEFPPADGEQDTAGEDVPMMSEAEKDNEKADSPETVRDTPAADGEHPDPPESVPQPGPGPHHRHCHGTGFRGRGRCGGRGGGMRGHHHHHHHQGCHPHSPPPPPPPYGAHDGPGFPWNVGPMMAAFAQHPIAQGLRDYMNRAAGHGNDTTRNGDDVESFTPPVDIFRTAGGWVLHIALPGARKEDVGVNWDGDRSVLSVSGVVHRPGDEEFLQGLVNGERRVGLFQRNVTLPPPGAEANERDEVDAEGITARMEDGVLIVGVPLVEREWTEVRKVDIE